MRLPEKFEKGIKIPENIKHDSLWFIFNKDQIIVKNKDKAETIPHYEDLSEIYLISDKKIYLGTFGSKDCFAKEIEHDLKLPPNLTFKRYRKQYGIMDEDMFFLAGYAFQMMKWDSASGFCSKCGSIMILSSTECAKVCSKCDFINYPRLSPAIIVAVVKDRQILLGRSSRFPSGMYSVLAGFVDPGESLESCVHREIFEEANIRVKNISYFGSQFWPFSESLMIGFTAEYSSGEIMVDKDELEDARWFFPEEIPLVPDNLSISRKLIDWFISDQ